MADPELIPITDERGTTVWVHRPPPHCPSGHPWAAGNHGYSEGYHQCGCDAARATGRHPGHHVYTCKTCQAVTLVPPCTNPDPAAGWGASHRH